MILVNLGISDVTVTSLFSYVTVMMFSTLATFTNFVTKLKLAKLPGLAIVASRSLDFSNILLH